MEKFKNRYEAGQLLAEKISQLNIPDISMILALPRGGVPVAFEIAKKLQKPLDVFIVRKLGVPGQPELAFGAIAAGNIEIYNETILKEISLYQTQINAVLQAEKKELIRREQQYRGNQPFPTISGQTIMLVDDGIATGATVTAAIKALRSRYPHQLILAVPVMSADTYPKMQTLADDVVCLKMPKHFNAVGEWYQDFSQTEDEEVHALLACAKVE